MEWELPDVYVDGVLRIELIGDLVRIINFRWAIVEGTLTKMPVVSIVKPRSSLWGRPEAADCDIVRLTPERPKMSA